MSDYPSPSLSVKLRGEQFGGWSRSFRTSLESREARDIIAHENEQGFWRLWVVARCEEEFEKAVEEAVNFYRWKYGIDRPKAKLRGDLARALKKTWRPNERAIHKEMAAIKKAKKEELSWLRSTLRLRRPTARRS